MSSGMRYPCVARPGKYQHNPLLYIDYIQNVDLDAAALCAVLLDCDQSESRASPVAEGRAERSGLSTATARRPPISYRGLIRHTAIYTHAPVLVTLVTVVTALK